MSDRQLHRHDLLTVAVAGMLAGFLFHDGIPVTAQVTSPTMLHPNLGVRAVVTGLTQPSTMAFIGENDLLVLEKSTGRVQRVVNGAIDSTVLDLAVNFGSERGLLGVALHPDFPGNPGVYLYWTESTTGSDTNVLADTPLLGNRVDRYNWNGSTLSFDRNLIQLRALQPAFAAEPTPPQGRGNHDGGVLAFGFIGVILGPVLLALGIALGRAWITTQSAQVPEAAAATATAVITTAAQSENEADTKSEPVR